jgi:multidrug efflux pump subunit AcrB
MNVVRFCRENQYAVYLLTAFLTIAGLVAVFQLPSNIYPELNFPRIVVLAHSSDLAPDTMLLTVTRPLEESVSTTMGVRRVRPILMTTLATLFGLLPLALGIGSGAELQKPPALAVIGGLLLSTFITLLVMLVLYSLLDRRG